MDRKWQAAQRSALAGIGPRVGSFAVSLGRPWMAGLVLALLGAACAASAAPAPAPSTVPITQAEAGSGERRSDAGSVTIVVSWLAGSVPSARVVLDTHSVDLDSVDLARAARVRLDSGAWVTPSALDAPAGGHHREGTLAFAALDQKAFDAARTVELELVDVAAPSRTFRWERAS